MKKILLITPNLIGLKDGLNRIQPPLGLMIISTTLIKNGYDVKILDTALEGWDNKVEIGLNKVLIGLSNEKIGDFIKIIIQILLVFQYFF